MIERIVIDRAHRDLSVDVSPRPPPGAGPLYRRGLRADVAGVPAKPGGVNAVNPYHDFASGVRDDRPGTRQLPARPAEGRRARRLEARPPGPEPRLSGQHPVQDLSPRVGLRVLAGQGAHIDTTTAAGRLVVRHLRGADRVRPGADPRTHRGRAQGRPGPPDARAAGSSPCRKRRCGWPRPRWRTAARRCRSCVGAVPRTRHQAGDALQRVVCGRGRCGTWNASCSMLLNCSVMTPVSLGQKPCRSPTPTSPAPA